MKLVGKPGVANALRVSFLTPPFDISFNVFEPAINNYYKVIFTETPIIRGCILSSSTIINNVNAGNTIIIEAING